MTSYDDLFTATETIGADGGKIQEVALSDLFPFRNHPFKILEDQSMEDMVESVREHGVLMPGIARPRPEGGYELVAGHRRRHASQLAGRDTMPVVIRDLDDVIDLSGVQLLGAVPEREGPLPAPGEEPLPGPFGQELDAIARRLMGERVELTLFP